jgi:hypothetical protein
MTLYCIDLCLLWRRADPAPTILLLLQWPNCRKSLSSGRSVCNPSHDIDSLKCLLRAALCFRHAINLTNRTRNSLATFPCQLQSVQGHRTTYQPPNLCLPFSVSRYVPHRLFMLQWGNQLAQCWRCVPFGVACESKSYVNWMDVP